jgi:hypothetical protein
MFKASFHRVILLGVLLLISISTIRCANDSDNMKSDFIQFEISKDDVSYQFKDSAFLYCGPSPIPFNAKYFESRKVVAINEGGFDFVGLIISKDDIEDCPADRIDNDYKFTLKLSKSFNNDFVDYYNIETMDGLTWEQKLYNGKILLNGKFEGWIYKWLSNRTSNVEVKKLDSIFIQGGKFQVTLE